MPKSNATGRNSPSPRPSIRSMTAKVDGAQPLVIEFVSRTRMPLWRVSPVAGTLSTDGLVMAEAAFPHGARGGPGEQKPTALNRQALRHLRSAKAFHENRDREKEFVIKRQPFHHRLDSRGHDVDGEHLAAEEIFERVNDENDSRDFQDPERHHCQAVSDEELNECRHYDRYRREEVSQRVLRQHDIVAKIKEDQR